MKKNLTCNYQRLDGKSNIFKFGANHAIKYKGLGHPTPDVGNFVLNMADAEAKRSLLISILENSGNISGFFGENIEVDGEPYL